MGYYKKMNSEQNEELDIEIIELTAEAIEELQKTLDDLVDSDFENEEEFNKAFNMAQMGVLLLKDFIVKKQIRFISQRIERK